MKTMMLWVFAMFAGAALATEEDKEAVVEKALATARVALDEAAKEYADVYKRIVFNSDSAFLGILIEEADEDGIELAGVTSGGGAEDAGLREDDVIVGVNGEVLTGQDNPLRILRRVMDDVTPGDTVRLDVNRDGQSLAFDVVTTETNLFSGWADEDFHVMDHDGSWFGMRFGEGFASRLGGLELVDIGLDLGDYFGVDGGVLVLRAPAEGELKPGDILRRIDGVAVVNAQQAYRLLHEIEEEGEVTVNVHRKRKDIEVTAAWGIFNWSVPRKSKDVDVMISPPRSRGRQ